MGDETESQVWGEGSPCFIGGSQMVGTQSLSFICTAQAGPAEALFDRNVSFTIQDLP